MNFIAFNLYLKLLNLRHRIDRRKPCFAFEYPTMPGTLNGQVDRINVTFAKRAASVRTSVIERVKLSVDVEHGYAIAADFNRQALALRQVGKLRYFNKHLTLLKFCLYAIVALRRQQELSILATGR